MRSSTRTWLIGPLCGTLNSAAQTPIVTVNVALQYVRYAQIAACADPIAAEVFWMDGHGAYLRRETATLTWPRRLKPA
jgi:myo-inositol-1(or 4)-monophosphatase